MSPLLRALRNDALSQVKAGALRFFEPTPAFFEALTPYKDKKFVDAGAGVGHITEQARAQGFQMLPVDIMPREGQVVEVLCMEAESVPYSPEVCLLMCRPDHSGWVYETLSIALKAGACAFYAGLPHNFERDLEDFIGTEVQSWTDVGEEGEMLLLFTPASLSKILTL